MTSGETLAATQQWNTNLDETTQRVEPRFARAEPLQRMRRYLEDLLRPVGHKNGWQLATSVGKAMPCSMQRLLAGAR